MENPLRNQQTEDGRPKARREKKKKKHDKWKRVLGRNSNKGSKLKYKRKIISIPPAR